MVKKLVKSINKNRGTNSNRSIKRSSRFNIGKNEGILEALEFITADNGKEYLKLKICNKKTGKSGTYYIVLGNSYGERLVDMLIDIIFGEDYDNEVDLDECVGYMIGFETKLNGNFENLVAFYSVESDEEEELEDDYELEEEELLEYEEE